MADCWFQVTSDMQNILLVNALSEILEQCHNQKYYIVFLNSDVNDVSDGLFSNHQENGVELEPTLFHEDFIFHENLRIHTFQNVEEVRKFYLDNIQLLKSQFGILVFLYSVLMTRVCITGFRDNCSKSVCPGFRTRPV